MLQKAWNFRTSNIFVILHFLTEALKVFQYACQVGGYVGTKKRAGSSHAEGLEKSNGNLGGGGWIGWLKSLMER